MKFKIDDEVLFKYIHHYNDWFITKGVIIAYSESMSYSDQSHYSSPQAVSVSSSTVYSGPISGSISMNLQRLPGYLIKTTHNGIHSIPESHITDVMKKEAFKKELDKIISEIE